MYKFTKLLIGILIFTQFLSCSNKQSDQYISENDENIYYTPPINLQIISSGILISLSDIPDDVTSIHVEINNWGDRVYTYQNNDYPPKYRDMITSSSSMITGNALENIRQSNQIIFPFVKTGQIYNVSVTYSIPSYTCASAPFERIIADNGIYLEKDIELLLNDDNTSVRLSEEPKFSSNVGYNIISQYFSFSLYNEIMSSTLGSISTDNNNILSWDFEPSIREQINRHNGTEEVSINGNYNAYIGYSMMIIYDNIEWYNQFIKSPKFIYTVF
jgi:hypothetical protein